MAAKLGIRPGTRVAVLGAPPGWSLGELPAEVAVQRRVGPGPYDVMLAFGTQSAALATRLSRARPALSDAGGLWLAWPKRASGVITDLGEGAVREMGLAAGLVDNKICAVDDTWSALRFVYRRADRRRART